MKDKDFNFNMLIDLENLLKARKQRLPKNSYTANLFNAGLIKILDKLGEEVIELMVAVRCSHKKHIIYEAADALFHLIVLAVFMDLSLEHILPPGGKSTERSLRRLMHKKDREGGFFYRVLSHNLGDVIYKSGKYDGSLDQYKIISDSCSALFLCVLAICKLCDVHYRDIERELENRTSVDEVEESRARQNIH